VDCAFFDQLSTKSSRHDEKLLFWNRNAHKEERQETTSSNER